MKKKIETRTSWHKYKKLEPEKTGICIMCDKPAIKKTGEPDLCYGHWVQHTCPILPNAKPTN